MPIVCKFTIPILVLVLFYATEGTAVFGKLYRCTLPLIHGKCRGNFVRYGYDERLGRCQKFLYGGCGGNKNRFPSMEKCMERCQHVDVR
ncbi:hypothetical protein AAHC03_019043 [Spirometra sp. Aus1]